jgi:uncharacterized membrane protein (DUF4010 family)
MNPIDLKNILSEDLTQIFWRLGICILIGILVGAEREHSKKEGKIFAGIRTFPLISILGFLSALISSFTSYFVLITVFIGFCLMVISSYVMFALDGKRGVTTDMAGLIVFLLGALTYWNFIVFSISVAVVVTGLLSLQPQLGAWTRKIVEEDIYATLKFATITLIILPILPNHTFGPFDILNPYQIWLMVILIAGINFLGYVLFKLTKTEKAIPLVGLVGGIVSSTAVALTFSQRSKEMANLGKLFASAIILASTIMLPRVLLETFILNQSLFYHLLIPVSILTVFSALVSLFLWHNAKSQAVESVSLSNPFKLRTAIKFGLLFAGILFISKASQIYIGNTGIYYTSILDGLADVSAVTLSLCNLAQSTISNSVASIGIILAIMTNTLVKCGIVLFIGEVSLRKNIIMSYLVIFIVAFIVLLFV